MRACSRGDGSEAEMEAHRARYYSQDAAQPLSVEPGQLRARAQRQFWSMARRRVAMVAAVAAAACALRGEQSGGRVYKGARG